jgi:hypothetical protein
VRRSETAATVPLDDFFLALHWCICSVEHYEPLATLYRPRKSCAHVATIFQPGTEPSSTTGATIIVVDEEILKPIREMLEPRKSSAHVASCLIRLMAFGEDGASRGNAGAVFRESVCRLRFSSTSHDPAHRPHRDRLPNRLVSTDLGKRSLVRRLFCERPIVLSSLPNNQCIGRSRTLILRHTRKTLALANQHRPRFYASQSLRVNEGLNCPGTWAKTRAFTCTGTWARTRAFTCELPLSWSTKKY